ncbi:MAG: NAD-dependent dehydratase [Pseudomonadota bacterium]
MTTEPQGVLQRPTERVGAVPDRHRVILVGATGLVGREAAQQAADNPYIGLACPVRQVPPDATERHGMSEVDFDDLEASEFDWKADGIAISLGTTMKSAGSREAFEAVDLGLVIDVARRAREAGTPTCAVVSSINASARSGNFYLRTKGRMEEALRALGFPTLVVLRPSLLAGQRRELRIGEQLGLLAAAVFRPLVPERYRAVPADAVARALLAGAMDRLPGERLIRSEDIR